MKKALIIVVMVAIVAIAGSMVYYFVFFKTGIINTEKAQQVQQEQKMQSSKVVVATTKSETEVDKFNKELKELRNFIGDYSALIKNYENEWAIIRSDVPNKKIYTSDEIIKLQADELNIIKGLLVFPKSVTKYIEYDISYIEAMSRFYGTMAIVGENFKNPVLSEVYPEFSKDLENMTNLLKQRDTELRNIYIDFNNRAKELGLPVPFPNQ
ncbi:MAG: hypothetical protein ACYCXB_05195 [Candidatus Humimicrobiaceae bacterium]